MNPMMTPESDIDRAADTDFDRLIQQVHAMGKDVLAVHKVIGHVPLGKVGDDIDMDKMIPIAATEPAEG